jgi:iron complex outermembrane recepter protein
MKYRGSFLYSITIVASYMSVFTSGPVHAQTGTAAQPDGLAEIVVTAQRREESLDKVPISVTAFSQKTMDELHIQTFADLATVVPGLVITTTTATVQANSDVAIRGIFSGGNAPTTAIYIDETPITIRQINNSAISGSPHPDIFDLDRIEVLRGPQGTLFGSSAMGGAIRYITPQPSLDTESGYTKEEISYTDRGEPSYAVGVAYGAPIVEGLAGFRLSGWYHQDGGFIDIEDPFTGQIERRNANAANAYVFRPSFTLAPTEGLTITPAVFIQHQHSDAPSTYWLTLIPRPENGAQVDGDLVPQPVTDDLSVSSLAVKYEFNGMSLQSDTSYLDRSYEDDDDWSTMLAPLLGGPPIIPSLSSFRAYDHNSIWTKAWQQEFRLTSQDPNSRISWVLGAYYRHAAQVDSQIVAPDFSPVTEALFGESSLQYFGVPDFNYGGQEVPQYTWYKTVDEQKAVFGEITAEIVPRFKANIGVRIEHSAVEQQHEINAGPFLGLTYSNIVLPDQVQTPITPRFGLTYQYTDQDMVYATAAKGYRAGGSNAADATDNPLCNASAAALGLKSVPVPFNSDTLWSYEVGSKNSFFDRHLALQASIYFIDWTNIQTPVALPSCGEEFTANRGKALSRGFDLQVAATPIEGLRLSANAGYTDAFYPSASYGPLSNGVAPLLIGAGDKIQGVVPWTASFHGEYSRDIGWLWNAARSYIRVDYRWLDAFPKADPNVANYDPTINPIQNEAYGVLNLRFGVLHEGLDLSVFVNNATRSDPILGLTHSGIGDPLFEATALQPLTVGITSEYRF